MLRVKTFSGGYDNNLSYVLYNEKEAVIIDISINPKVLLEFIKEKNLKLKFVIIMHSHFDHLVGYGFYKENRIKIAASENCQKEVDIKLKDNDELEVGKFKLKVISTPGHLFDCICISVDGKLFTSDTLFINTVGRCDLAGADVNKMYNSLYEKIMKLPAETVIYPGHDYAEKRTATLADLRKSNKYLQAKSREEFVRKRNIR